MFKQGLFLLLVGIAACEPNVVDAVREPAPAVVPPDPKPMSPLQKSLIHRYSFEGDGTEAFDSKFAANGKIVGASLTGTGSLRLAGNKSLEYVDLPNGIVKGLTDATFEAWLTWTGAGSWQRIFDFGGSVGGENPYPPAEAPAEGPVNFAGTSYLFLTTNAGVDSTRGLPSGLRVAYSQNGVGDENVCNGADQPFPKGGPHHVAVVIDAVAGTMALYQDGAVVNECPLTRSLSAIGDVNNWLGRSNFTQDVELGANYDEFRIYAAALSATEIADSFKAGPDAAP